MSPEELRSRVLRLFDEVWSKHDFSNVEEFIAPEYILHGSQPALQGRDGYIQFVKLHLFSFPDIHFTVEDFISAGDKTVTRWTARGTHRGPFIGVPPTGKEFTTGGVSIHRINNEGKIVEDWGLVDNLNVLLQLGAEITPPATTST